VESSGGKNEKKAPVVQPDTPINFLQLSKLDSLMGAGDMLDLSLSAALGTGRISSADFASSKLHKVVKYFRLVVFSRVVDPDRSAWTAWIRINLSRWIRIRIQEGQNGPQK
jgi:hypothetical protein